MIHHTQRVPGGRSRYSRAPSKLNNRAARLKALLAKKSQLRCAGAECSAIGNVNKPTTAISDAVVHQRKPGMRASTRIRAENTRHEKKAAAPVRTLIVTG